MTSKEIELVQKFMGWRPASEYAKTQTHQYDSNAFWLSEIAFQLSCLSECLGCFDPDKGLQGLGYMKWDQFFPGLKKEDSE